MDLLVHLSMHSLVDLVCALNGDWTLSLGVSGRCSYKLSYFIHLRHDSEKGSRLYQTATQAMARHG